MNNSLDLGNNTEHSDLHEDFKRTVRNSHQNLKYISKRRPPAEVNEHPENQTTFFKVPITPSDKSYSNTITKRTEEENILNFSEGIASRIKMYNFNKALKNENTNNLSLKQLSQNVLDVNLKVETPETVLKHAGINNVLNDNSQSNIENLLSNIK